MAFVAAQVILLRFPYPRKVDEPNIYETIRIHAEFSTADAENGQPDFSVSTYTVTTLMSMP